MSIDYSFFFDVDILTFMSYMVLKRSIPLVCFSQAQATGVNTYIIEYLKKYHISLKTYDYMDCCTTIHRPFWRKCIVFICIHYGSKKSDQLLLW